MLVIASKSTIMMLLTIIAVAMCVIVIAAATVSCNAAKKTPVYETQTNNTNEEHGKEG